MTRFALLLPTLLLLAGPVLGPVLGPVFVRSAAAEPMKGTYELRCQDPRTRQWSVAGRISDPEMVDKPGGGREVRGRGADGKPLTLPMPADRTCMLSGV